MNTRRVRNLVNVFMESPIYVSLSRRERHELLARFIDLYSEPTDPEAATEPGRLHPDDDPARR
jgi:hypothetical protein